MKTLEEMGNELGESISRYEKTKFTSFPKVCTYCNHLKSNPNDLESIFETGMCLGCDHSFGESIELETI